MTKRNKGTGSIYYREDRKVYEGKIKVGTQYNGKPIYKHVTRKRKTDVQNELISIGAKLNEGAYTAQSNAKAIDWLYDWLETYMQNNIKEQTYNTYNMVIKKMLAPFLRDVQLKNLTPLMLQNAFNELSVKYAPSTLRKIKNILNSALRAARENELIAKDPFVGVKLPKLQKPKIESLSIQDIEKLMKVAQNYNIYEAIEIAFSTGLRIGEVLALEWEDVDYKKAELNITKTLIRSENDKGKEVLKVQYTLKTESSLRTVPLNHRNVDLLKDLKKRRSVDDITDNGIIFCSTRGTHIYFRNFNRSLEAICEKAGIKRISANILRHSFASIAIERKADVKAVSKIMGHTKIETTFNNYVHPSKNRTKEVAEIMSLTDNKTDKPNGNR
jgi:integrase